MKKIENIYICDCGKLFAWRFVKLDNGDFWFGKIEDRILNCVNFVETSNIYSLELKCPYCEKRHFVTIQK